MRQWLVVIMISLFLPISGYSAYGVYDLIGEFTEQMKANPIDQDYRGECKELSNSSKFNTMEAVKLEEKYIRIWDQELNHIYQMLMEKLDRDEYELLRKSQKGWLEHHQQEHEFANRFLFQRRSGRLLGTQGMVQLRLAFKDRIRARTLELMEYYLFVSGDDKIKFKYKNVILKATIRP